MTHREMILATLNKKVGARKSLADITAAVAKRKKLSQADSRYLSGTLSTLLINMVEKKEVFVDGRSSGPLGGKLYYTRK